MINLIKGASFANRLRGFSVLSVIVGFLWILARVSFFSTYLIYGTLIFAAGIMAGIASGYYFEQRELKIIKEKGEKKLTIGTWLLAFSGLFIILGLLWVFSSQTNLFTVQVIMAALYFFSAPFIPSLTEARIYIIKKWQGTNQCEVLSDIGFFSGRIYASPPKFGR